MAMGTPKNWNKTADGVWMHDTRSLIVEVGKQFSFFEPQSDDWHFRVVREEGFMGGEKLLQREFDSKRHAEQAAVRWMEDHPEGV